MKLVNMVIEEGYAVTRASKKLCIKLCTARVILSKYRKTGTFPMKKTTK